MEKITYKEFFNWYTKAYINEFYGNMNYFSDVSSELFKFLQKEEIIEKNKCYIGLNKELTGVVGQKSVKSISIGMKSKFFNNMTKNNNVNIDYILRMTEDKQFILYRQMNSMFMAKFDEIKMDGKHKLDFDKKVDELIRKKIDALPLYIFKCQDCSI